MVYFFSFFITACILLYLCINPVVRLIDHAGFFVEWVELYSNFMTSLNLTELLTNLNVLVVDVVGFVSRNMSKMWLNFCGVGIILVFLNTVILNLTSMASCKSLHFYMGSMTKQGLFSTFCENFWKNLRTH